MPVVSSSLLTRAISTLVDVAGSQTHSVGSGLCVHRHSSGGQLGLSRLQFDEHQPSVTVDAMERLLLSLPADSVAQCNKAIPLKDGAWPPEANQHLGLY